jgi:mevalonate kinase
MDSYYAHGKLLLTGEYFILDGAVSLALPTRFGQRMDVLHQDVSRMLHWKSLDMYGNNWLEGTWDPELGEWGYISNPEKGKFLTALLEYACNEIGLDLSGLSVTSQLEFPQDWGLGSSSTLVSLLAQWWRTDPFTLLRISFGGSGYDVACATAESPILYQLKGGVPKYEPVGFNPSLRDSLYFLHLNQKQDSREGIQYYRNLKEDKSPWVTEISDISRKLLRCEDFDEMEYLLMLHEAIVSRVLGLEKVKDKLFPDYWGAIKSLGAWGGDFVLISSSESEAETRSYFAELGFETMIGYKDMVLQADGGNIRP